MKNKVPLWFFFSHQIGKIESRLVIFSYGEVYRGKHICVSTYCWEFGLGKVIGQYLFMLKMHIFFDQAVLLWEINPTICTGC